MTGQAARAGTLTLDFLPTNTFSGTAPAGTLGVTITDSKSLATLNSNQVQLMITSSLASGENLDPGKALYLNIVPALSGDLGNLTFLLTANTGFSQAASVNTKEDDFKADGGGKYDILFTYLPSTKAFGTGQSQTYTVTDTTSGATLTASDFDTKSTTLGGNGTWLAAIHVQNTPSGSSGSAFVSGTGSVTDPHAVVPEPSTLLIAGPAALGFVIYGLRRRRAQ
jgi:hypothetical protein